MKQLYTQTLHNMAESLKTLRPYTIAGQSFVNECLQHIKRAPLTLSRAKWMLESANSIKNDVKLNAWKNEQLLQFDFDSIKTKLSIVCESLDMESPNQAAAIGQAEELVANEPNDKCVLKSIVVDHVLDKYNMYPEIAELIANAKQMYMQKEGSNAIVEMETEQMLVVRSGNDMIGWPKTGAWYGLNDSGTLYFAAAAPNEDAVALMNALSMIKFVPSTNRFEADTMLGKVQIAGRDSILIDGAIITADAFAERVKQYMTIHQTQMDVEGSASVETNIANAVVTVASMYDSIMLLDSSLVLGNVAIYASGTVFNVIANGVITTFDNILKLINYLVEEHMSANLVDAVKAKWSILYDDAKLVVVSMSAQLEAYNSTLNDLMSQIEAAKSKQASMDAESEGYAAYQLVIDKYEQLAARLRDKVNDYTQKLAK